MSATQRRIPSTSKQSSDNAEEQEPLKKSARNLNRSSSFSQQSLSQALASTAHLANLLPTGTLLAFQLLTPVFTNNGVCDAATRRLTFALLSLLAVSCALACFTDSIQDKDGRVYYGLATPNGLWLFEDPTEATTEEMYKYRLRFVDVVHAVLSVMVFITIALKDKNVVGCFYPSPGKETAEVLNLLPLGVGVVCSLLFVVFPTRRHGFGNPVSVGN